MVKEGGNVFDPIVRQLPTSLRLPSSAQVIVLVFLRLNFPPSIPTA